MTRSGHVRLIISVLTLMPLTAGAEPGVYSAYAGAGAAVVMPFTSPAHVDACLILESVYGLTNQINLEAPVLFEVGRTPAVTLGPGVEYVLHRTNHLRVNVGAGLALTLPLTASPLEHLGVSPFVEGAVRWLFAWGLGLSLSLHALASIDVRHADTGSTFQLHPTLSLYQEFW